MTMTELQPLSSKGHRPFPGSKRTGRPKKDEKYNSHKNKTTGAATSCAQQWSMAEAYLKAKLGSPTAMDKFGTPIGLKVTRRIGDEVGFDVVWFDRLFPKLQTNNFFPLEVVTRELNSTKLGREIRQHYAELS